MPSVHKWSSTKIEFFLILQQNKVWFYCLLQIRWESRQGFGGKAKEQISGELESIVTEEDNLDSNSQSFIKVFFSFLHRKNSQTFIKMDDFRKEKEFEEWEIIFLSQRRKKISRKGKILRERERFEEKENISWKIVMFWLQRKILSERKDFRGGERS